MRAILGWTPEKRRKAALAFLAGAVALLALVVALPIWFAHRHYDAALDDLDRRLSRYERLAAARPALERKLVAVRAMDSRRYFLKTSAASLSSAEMQERVRQFVEAAGGRIVSVQVGQPRDEGRFRQVSVTLQLNASTPVLRKILLALESSEPYVFVDSLMVRAQVPPGYKPPPGMEPEMFIQLDISAYAIAG
ncbi:MAG: type II secretion system protein M [Betaproteobacteria bacterium]|nr:type II secretion system protein M [Betaproteobacteria bacterium]